MNIPRTNAILPLIAGQDLTNREGFPFRIDGGEVFLCTDPANHTPHGVILKGAAQGEPTSAALASGYAGTILVKLAGTVSIGDALYLTDDGTGVCVASASGTVAFAAAAEPGVAEEMIEAALITPLQVLPPAPAAIPDLLLVEGAGTTVFNGLYYRNGESDGKPRYDQIDGDGKISYDDGMGAWLFEDGAGVLYDAAFSVATPDLVPSWTVMTGDAPTPTITRLNI